MGLLIRPQAGGFSGTLETWAGTKRRSLTFNVGGGRALGADSSGGPPYRWGESVCPPGDMSSHLKTLLIAALSGWVLLWHLRGKVQECGYTSFDARESTLTAPTPTPECYPAPHGRCAERKRPRPGASAPPSCPLCRARAGPLARGGELAASLLPHPVPGQSRLSGNSSFLQGRRPPFVPRMSGWQFR